MPSVMLQNGGACAAPSGEQGRQAIQAHSKASRQNSALYVYGVAGARRRIYVVTAVLALYLNVFVRIVQAFGKVPVLHSLAPTQAEPPFAIAQGIVFVAFLGFGALAVNQFHPRA